MLCLGDAGAREYGPFQACSLVCLVESTQRINVAIVRQRSCSTELGVVIGVHALGQKIFKNMSKGSDQRYDLSLGNLKLGIGFLLFLFKVFVGRHFLLLFF